MPSGSYSSQQRKQAAQPAPSRSQMRIGSLKRLAQLIDDENPQVAIAAIRASLGLDEPERERERSAEAALASNEERRATAARLVAEAFAEIMKPAQPVVELLPGEPAIPAPEAEDNGKAEAAKSVKIAPAARPIPFARAYGRRLSRGY